jgi:hypothetical protein
MTGPFSYFCGGYKWRSCQNNADSKVGGEALYCLSLPCCSQYAKIKLPDSLTSQVPSHTDEVPNLRTEDVTMCCLLRGQYGAMAEWCSAGEKQRSSEKTLPLCHFIHHEPRRKPPGTELQEKPAHSHLSYGAVRSADTKYNLKPVNWLVQRSAHIDVHDFSIVCLFFFYLVGWDLTPLGPFAGPLGSYKPQY